MDKEGSAKTSKNEGKVIQPLKKLLMDTPLDELVYFIQKLHLRFSFTGGGKIGAHYCARIFGDGLLNYYGTSTNSPKDAICSSLAKFLIHENHDIHDYGWK